MSRYFFHIRDGLIFVPDEEGMECRDLPAAWQGAPASARDIAPADLRSRFGPAAIVEIEDKDGTAIETISATPALN